MYDGKIIRKKEVSIEQIIKEIKKSPEFKKTGAITSFIGVVRGFSDKGEEVDRLYIEAWEDKATSSLKNIAKELSTRKGITVVVIYHIIGELNVGDDIVYVIVAGDHRENIFPILMEAVEKYKSEVEVWKKEILKNGQEYWTEKL
ncbi:MAG: molybdenum cofactor biosynthesis protein MoaE [Candidatus Odinarchaeia archaeon]